MLVSEMDSRLTVGMTQCGASRWARPKEGTRNAQCGVRERGADVQRENDMSGVLNGGKQQWPSGFFCAV